MLIALKAVLCLCGHGGAGGGWAVGRMGGREAGVSITKFSFRALFSLLIGCIDLAQEMKSVSPLVLLQSDGRLPQEGGSSCGLWRCVCTGIALFLYSGSAASERS